MKKLLLTRAGALALTLSLSAGVISPLANAAEVTDELSYTTLGITSPSTTYYLYDYNDTESGAAYNIVCASGNSSIQINTGNVSATASSNAAGKARGIASTASGGILKQIVITWNTNTADTRVLNIYAGNEAYESTASIASATKVGSLKKGDAVDLVSTYTFTEDYTYVAFGSNAGAQYIDKIEITWESATASSVDRPVISCVDNKVTIAAGESGADAIYYTTDGTEPTEASTLYSAPFAITANTTVTAIAKKGSELSKVATFEAQYVGTYANFAELAAAEAGTLGKVTGPIYVTYANGKNLWLKDAAGNYMLAWGTAQTAENGTAYTYIQGKLGANNGVPQITDYTLGEESTSSAIAPEDATLTDINDTKLNAYVKLEDVSISNVDGKNFVFTQGESNLNGYNAFNLDVTEGEGFNVVGVVGAYDGKLQIQPIEIVGGVKAVDKPVFTPAAGLYTKGTIVKVTCATEGASIYYTTDGTEATEASTPYTEAGIELTADMTINVIAVKAGMISTSASAEYTLYPEGTYMASFIFANGGNVADLTTSVIEPANVATETNSLNGVVFTSQEIDLTMSKGEGSDNPRWWLNGTEPDIYYNVRIYKNNTATISANRNGYKLKSVTFKQRDTNWNAGNSADSGTLDGKVWTAAEDAITTSVKFTFAGASRFNCIDVVYVEDENATSGIEEVGADENAPVEYFNLQGVRVANPEAGIYVRRQGSKVEKVYIK